MKRHQLSWIAALLIVLVNAVALAGAWWNRHGPQTAEFELSERELELPSNWQTMANDENSGLALQLNYRVVSPAKDRNGYEPLPNFQYNREAAWLDADKLRELGYQLSAADDTASESSREHWQRSHAVWLVLEFNGEAYQHSLHAAADWAAWVRTASADELRKSVQIRPDEDEIERELRQVREHSSRLFVIDAGLDPLALREHYADPKRYAIVSGRVRPYYYGDEANIVRGWRGRIDDIDVSELHVSTRWRSVAEKLEGQRYNPDNPIRFQARVAWGARYEPWLVAFSYLSDGSER